MKKLVTVIACLFLSLSIYAMELDFFWDIGDIFINGQMNIKKNVEGSLNAGSRVGEVIFQDNDSSLSIHVYPFIWNCENRFNPSKMINRFSFINTELFYDILHFDNSSITVGPYISANYLDLINMSFVNYQADVGFKFSYYMKESNCNYFKPETVTLRTGFRVRDNAPSVFLEGSVNLGSFILCFINDSYERSKDFKKNN